jgi:superfamily II DNA/RNA helicase
VVKLEKLEEAAENKKFAIYDAIFSSTPDESVISEMLMEFSATLPVQIVDKLNWNMLPDIRKAITEESNEVPVEDRSVLGKVIKQSISYSKFELLRRAKFFSKDHLEPFLENAGLSR